MPSSQADRISLDTPEARRKDSSGSASNDKDAFKSTRDSWTKKHSTGGEAASKSNSLTVNHYTHCGRHTDQYLFGGHSLMDLFRKKN
ncbi:hypothetical protein F4861DRAFT_398033 [Xylaria intraflava]|nr:hypothetical protein F4861DRAFT_398033 [Xylaria intraflava]